LGPLILVLASIHDLTFAYALMIAIGVCGGAFVVPLNALLQERGHESIGAGNALAVQNFAENIAMLVFVATYGWAAAAGISVATTVIGFGIVMLLVIGALAAFRFRDR
jgi:LPLT family lysophospholipid transporter-like MFS transporter